MYPFLKELLAEGFLEDGWESVEDAQGRPPRRNYTVTPDGVDYLAKFLSGATSPSRRRAAVARFKPKVVGT
jgi:PadR family transcriptional regulator PadR